VSLGAVVALSLAFGAMAQPQQPGGVSPEVRAKVDAAQAAAVASDLKLDAEKSAKLAEVYAAFQKEMAAAPRPEGGARGDWEAIRKMQEERQAKLSESLAGVLDETQAKAAASVLAGNTRAWDQMVAVLLSFELEEAKTAEALGHTLAYVKAGAKARDEAVAGGGMEGVREAMAAARKTLDDNLAPLLNDEQKAKWAEATQRRPRGGADSAPGGRGDRGDRGERPGRGGAPEGGAVN
jgi:hypothetical protein